LANENLDLILEDDSLEIFVRVNPENIDIFNKIVEAYDNLALVTAIHPQEGKLLVRVTKDTKKDTIKVLKHLPFPVEFCHK
jgi:hypothetical protein